MVVRKYTTVLIPHVVQNLMSSVCDSVGSVLLFFCFNRRMEEMTPLCPSCHILKNIKASSEKQL